MSFYFFVYEHSTAPVSSQNDHKGRKIKKSPGDFSPGLLINKLEYRAELFCISAYTVPLLQDGFWLQYRRQMLESSNRARCCRLYRSVLSKARKMILGLLGGRCFSRGRLRTVSYSSSRFLIFIVCCLSNSPNHFRRTSYPPHQIPSCRDGVYHRSWAFGSNFIAVPACA